MDKRRTDPDEWECGDCGAWVMGGSDWCSCHEADDKALRLQQVGGSHYIKYDIQPFDIIDCYGLNFYEGSALKYLLRHRDKGGVEDLKKARHYIEVLIKKAEVANGGPDAD